MFILAAREIGPPSKLTLRKERSLRSHTPMTCVRLKDNLYPYLIPEMTLKDNNIQKSIERLDCLSSSNIITTISTKVFYFSNQTLLHRAFFACVHVRACLCMYVHTCVHVRVCALVREVQTSTAHAMLIILNISELTARRNARDSHLRHRAAEMKSSEQSLHPWQRQRF